jgi:KTSC domain
MEREPLASDVIASMGYDPVWKVLEIEFRRSREVYDYFGVPAEEYAAFRNAESKGTYLNKVFRTRDYRYERVGHPGSVTPNRENS